MSKLSGAKVSATGTPQKRALLLCNHIAASQSGDKPLLTEDEAQAFIKSFRTERELAIYNGYRKMFDAVRFYLASIFEWKCNYFECVNRLENFVVRHLNYGHTEEILNLVLHEVDQAKRDKVTTRVIKRFSNSLLMRMLEEDGEGGIRILKPVFELEKIRELQEEVKREQVNFKTAVSVIKDFLTTKKFNVRLYWAIVREMENWAKSPKSLIRVANMPKLKSYTDRYTIEEDYKDVAIDPELYEQYRRNYLSE